MHAAVKGLKEPYDYRRHENYGEGFFDKTFDIDPYYCQNLLHVRNTVRTGRRIACEGDMIFTGVCNGCI